MDTFYNLFNLKVIYLIDNAPVFYKLFHLLSLHSSFLFATYHYRAQGRQIPKENIVFGIFLLLYFLSWRAGLKGRRYRQSMHTYYKLIILFYKFIFLKNALFSRDYIQRVEDAQAGNRGDFATVETFNPQLMYLTLEGQFVSKQGHNISELITNVIFFLSRIF